MDGMTMDEEKNETTPKNEEQLTEGTSERVND